MAVKTNEKTYQRNDEHELRAAVRRIVAATPVTDIHTHLYAPPFGDLLLWGVDELLRYHYLIAEVLRVAPVTPEAFYALSDSAQAELIWDELFLKRAPISEACRGVLTALSQLGLELESRDLTAYRDHFAGRDVEAHIDTVFERANLDCVVMTNDPFDALEQPVWEGGFAGDKRFRAALRIDPVLNDPAGIAERLTGRGYAVGNVLDVRGEAEIRRFLSDQLTRMDALYMAVSLPPDFAYPDDSPRTALIERCIMPVAAEHNVPFAMMIGVKRAVNPALRLAGDGVGKADIGAVERLCAAYPNNKFLVTMLSRENQHELCAAARKFPNLLVFGCWWFLNNPSLIDEITRMRLEMLGLSVVPQHSDARVLEQVLYKWEHSKGVISAVLEDKFADLAATGWCVHESEIERDAARLLGGVFWEFLER